MVTRHSRVSKPDIEYSAIRYLVVDSNFAIASFVLDSIKYSKIKEEINSVEVIYSSYSVEDKAKFDNEFNSLEVRTTLMMGKMVVEVLNSNLYLSFFIAV